VLEEEPVTPGAPAWKAASKGGTSCWNSSRVKLVKSRNSVGRVCTSVNRKLAIHDASLNKRRQYSINRDKLGWPSGREASRQSLRPLASLGPPFEPGSPKCKVVYSMRRRPSKQRRTESVVGAEGGDV